MNRSHVLSVCTLVGFFSLLLGLFVWSRYLETANYLDPLDAESRIRESEVGTPTTVKLPPIRSSDPSRGSSSTEALVVVEFADFNCLYCRLVEPEIRRAMQAFPTQARLVWRDLPLNADQTDGLLPAIAGRCAQDQGKFWDMHDSLFATAKLDRKGIRAAGVAAGLEMAPFDDCIANNRHADELRAEIALARSSGISGSPTFFIGNQAVSGFLKAQELANLIGQTINAQTARR